MPRPSAGSATTTMRSSASVRPHPSRARRRAVAPASSTMPWSTPSSSDRRTGSGSSASSSSGIHTIARPERSSRWARPHRDPTTAAPRSCRRVVHRGGADHVRTDRCRGGEDRTGPEGGALPRSTWAGSSAEVHLVTAFDTAGSKSADRERRRRRLPRVDGVGSRAGRCSSHALPGDPADAILQVASEVNADLIVVGNKGMHGAARILGSVPNHIAHKASCSVLIVDTD